MEERRVWIICDNIGNKWKWKNQVFKIRGKTEILYYLTVAVSFHLVFNQLIQLQPKTQEMKI
jgi:hypothetical protein